MDSPQYLSWEIFVEWWRRILFYWGQSSTDSFNFFPLSRIFTLQQFFTIFKSNLNFHHSSMRWIWFDNVTRFSILLLNLERFLTLPSIYIIIFIDKLLLQPPSHPFCIFYLPLMLVEISNLLLSFVRSLAVINTQYLIILIFTLR